MIELADIRPLIAEAALHRLFGHIEVGDCWVWGRALTHDGYGKVYIDHTTWRVHRLVYQLLVRKLRKLEVLDHLCTNRVCCNPDHLEVVYKVENTKRSWPAKQSACRKGHPYTPANTYRSKRTGRRSCRQCARDRRVTRARSA